MTAQITQRTDDSVTIEVSIPLVRSMLQCEDAITGALNEAGCLAAEAALAQFDTDGSPIQLGDMKLTSKGRCHKTYQSPWGEVGIARHVYQSARGGRQFCPLERDARMILTSTPGFARLVSSKYAEMGSSQALRDLERNHQRHIARSYLKMLCDAVGAVAQAKEESWHYRLPRLEQAITQVAVGVDGTCMLLMEDGWREAMVGTISLYDASGHRQHTIQIGATPEYGKSRFYERMDRELHTIRQCYPKATYIGIADGAPGNWRFLKPRTDRQIVDFWHAVGYLGKAAAVMFSGDDQAADRATWFAKSRHRLKHKVGAASRLLREMKAWRAEHPGDADHPDGLDAAITYFGHQKVRMRYAQHVAAHDVIGSGVTEAACKTLVKQRLCQAGMRWKEAGAATVLSLRSLAHTDCRWEQFWQKVDRYGCAITA